MESNKFITHVLQDEYASSKDPNEILITKGIFTCFGVSIKTKDKMNVLIAHISAESIDKNIKSLMKLKKPFENEEQEILITFCGGHPKIDGDLYEENKNKLQSKLQEYFPNCKNIKYSGSFVEYAKNKEETPGENQALFKEGIILTMYTSPGESTKIKDIREALQEINPEKLTKKTAEYTDELEKLHNGNYEKDIDKYKKRRELLNDKLNRETSPSFLTSTEEKLPNYNISDLTTKNPLQKVECNQQ